MLLLQLQNRMELNSDFLLFLKPDQSSSHLLAQLMQRFLACQLQQQMLDEVDWQLLSPPFPLVFSDCIATEGYFKISRPEKSNNKVFKLHSGSRFNSLYVLYFTLCLLFQRFQICMNNIIQPNIKYFIKYWYSI